MKGAADGHVTVNKRHGGMPREGQRKRQFRLIASRPVSQRRRLEPAACSPCPDDDRGPYRLAGTEPGIHPLGLEGSNECMHVEAIRGWRPHLLPLSSG